MSQKKDSHNLKRNILNELSQSYSSIHKSYKYFKKLSKNKYKIIESANWVLDNLYLIEREYKNIKHNISNKYLLLNMSELWAFPLMLKINLILNLSKYIEELVLIQ